MENFTNSVLLPENLPEIELQKFNSLDKKYLTILYIRIFIFFLLTSCFLITYWILADEQLLRLVIYIGISAIVIITAYATVLTILGFPRKGYLIRENDISYEKGLITYKLISVTFNRIQHVEVNQGILAKIFKLSSLKIFTAGGTASDLSIPGLPVETAQNMKAFLSEKIREYE